MGNKRSLRYLISKYAVIELIYSFFIAVLFYLGLNILISSGVIYPANHTDIESEKIEARFKSDDWSLDEIPFYYDYLYLENGQVVENTIDKKYEKQVNAALKNGRASGNEIMSSNIFKSYTRTNKQLVIRYRISVTPTNEKLYRLFGNFEMVYIVLIFAIWFLGFVLLLMHSSNLLKKEINKIAVANENINKMDLDYKRDYSKYKEIDGVLSSIDVLANNLKKSLNEQWDMQMEQKEMIEGLTHDIRTPITLIKGNLDLLKEENPNVSSERFSDIANGIARLEEHIEKLKRFSYTVQGKKEIVSDEVIRYWTSLISSICRVNDFTLKLIENESSNISLDKEAIAIALQNILTNAVEHSGEGSTIYATFRDFEDKFEIRIRDEGKGFDENLLPVLTEKYISSKTENAGNKHGLGLSIVKNIVERNNGKLYLRNYCEEKSGAEVKMVFSKV